VTDDFASRRLIIRLIIQAIRRDPSGSIWIDEAPNVSRPFPAGADQIDAGAAGHGSGGWFLRSLPAAVSVALGSERRLVKEDGMDFEQTMDAIARGVEIIGIVTLVLGLAAALVRAGAGLDGRPECGGGLPDRPDGVWTQHSVGAGIPGRGRHHQDRGRSAVP
jgi:hypothetical protein